MPKISEKIVNLRDLQERVHEMRSNLTELGYRLDRIDDEYSKGAKDFGVPMRYDSEFERATKAIHNTLFKAIPRLEETLEEQRVVDKAVKNEAIASLIAKFFNRLDRMPELTQSVWQDVFKELERHPHEEKSTVEFLLAQDNPSPGKVAWTKWFKKHPALQNKTKTLELFHYLSELNYRELETSGSKDSTVIVPGPPAFRLPSDVPQSWIGIDETGNKLFVELKHGNKNEAELIEANSKKSHDDLRQASEKDTSPSTIRLGPIDYWYQSAGASANHELQYIGGLRTKTWKALNAGHIWFPYQLLDRIEPYQPRLKHFDQPIHQIKGIGKRVILELQYAFIKFGIQRHGLDLFTSSNPNHGVDPKNLPQEELLTECLLTAGVEHFRNSDREYNFDKHEYEKKELKTCLGDHMKSKLCDLVLPAYPLAKCYENFPPEAQHDRCHKIPIAVDSVLATAWHKVVQERTPEVEIPTYHFSFERGLTVEPTTDRILDVLTILRELENYSLEELWEDETKAQILLAEYFGWKSILGIHETKNKTWYEDQFKTKPWVLINGRACPVSRLLNLPVDDPKWFEKPLYEG
jgi:hypothetical protein